MSNPTSNAHLFLRRTAPYPLEKLHELLTRTDVILNAFNPVRPNHPTSSLLQALVWATKHSKAHFLAKVRAELPRWEGHEWERPWAPPYSHGKTVSRPSSGLNNHPHIFLPNPPNYHPPTPARRRPGSLKSGLSNPKALQNQKIRSAPPKAAPSFQTTNYKQIKSPANLSDGRQSQSAN